MRCKACNKIMQQGEYVWLPEQGEFTNTCAKCQRAVKYWNEDNPLQDSYVQELVSAASSAQALQED